MTKTRIISQHIGTMMIRNFILTTVGLLLFASLYAAEDGNPLSHNMEVREPQSSVQTAEQSLSQPMKTRWNTKAQYTAPAVSSPASFANYSATPIRSTASHAASASAVASTSSTSASASSLVATPSTQGITNFAASVSAPQPVVPAADKNSHSVKGEENPFSTRSFLSTSLSISERNVQQFAGQEPSTPMRRVDWGGDKPSEPFPDPVGEVPFCFMLLLVVAFVLYKQYTLCKTQNKA